MKRVPRLLLTIVLNVTLLTATGGWLLAQFRLTICRAMLIDGEDSVRIDPDGWLWQHTTSGFLPPDTARIGVRLFSYDQFDAQSLRWKVALSDENTSSPFPGVVWCRFDHDNLSTRPITALLGIRHWLILTMIWMCWLPWNWQSIKAPFARRVLKTSGDDGESPG